MARRTGTKNAIFPASALSILIHSILIAFFVYTNIDFFHEEQPVEVNLSPENMPQEETAKKPDLEGLKIRDGAQFGQEGGVKVKGDQPIPQIAKGEKPGPANDVKDKGPIGAEISNQGSPKGKDQGWTWGGENFTLAKAITPENRISKDRSFSVKGEASITVQADYAHFHIYVTSTDIKVSETNKPIGEINSIRDSDNQTQLFKDKFARAFLGRLKFTVTKDGDPVIQHATEVKPMGKLEPQIQHHFVSRQKILLTTDAQYIDEMMRTIVSIGASFSPINKKLYTTYSDSQMYYDKDVVTSGFDTGSASFTVSEMESPETRAARETGSAMGKAMRGNTSDDEKGMPGNETFLTFSVSEEKRKKYEDQVFNAALADAKAKAVKMSKELGLAIKDAVPLIERTITYSVKKDYSGAMIFKGSIILYY